MPTQYPKPHLSTPILTNGSEIGALDDWLDALRHARSRATLQTYRAGVKRYATWASKRYVGIMSKRIDGRWWYTTARLNEVLLDRRLPRV